MTIATTKAEEIIKGLEPIVKNLIQAPSTERKIIILEETPQVVSFLEKEPLFAEKIESLPLNSRLPIFSVITIGQGSHVFSHFDTEKPQTFNALLRVLQDVENFYDTIGGIVGYHLSVLKLLIQQNQALPIADNIHYYNPEGENFTEYNPNVAEKTRWGIESLGQLAEIYPVGGAGDRLQLICNIEQEPLPTAQLLLGGRTLLEGLVRDLQAREYLYYKLKGEQVVTPVALMTSQEKRNHQRILKIFEDNHWFGRSKESFRFFTQPFVPVMDEEGNWVVKKPLTLMLKPGGHGVIWKLALDDGIFDWFELLGKKKAVIRQINNPVAGTDYGLLAFSGIGFHHDKLFGFASCPRLTNTAEGTDVLVEKMEDNHYSYTLSNIEYTDFMKKGIEDRPVSEESPYSAFPANTNILFVDLKEMRHLSRRNPIPGMIINMKTFVEVTDPVGNKKRLRVGRLESTMQNISDEIHQEFPTPLVEGERDRLPSYITFNQRRKTLSVAKNAYSREKPIQGTPEGCLYEILLNIRDLLENHCGMVLPSLENEEEYLDHGPSLFAQFLPALGPLYQVIEQKITGGKITSHSDLILEITELQLKNLELDGSLFIEASHPLGSCNEEGIIRYNENSGKCILKNVKVQNKGIDYAAHDNAFWKNHLKRKEQCHIYLSGSAEFYAENVTLQGDLKLFVPNGHQMTAFDKGGKTCFEMKPINAPTWCWKYSYDSQNAIKLLLSEPV